MTSIRDQNQNSIHITYTKSYSKAAECFQLKLCFWMMRMIRVFVHVRVKVECSIVQYSTRNIVKMYELLFISMHIICNAANKSVS